MKEFATIDQLKAWLRAQGIPHEQWGQDNTKRVENLWAEIRSGESRLQADPPRRLVDVVQLMIHRDDKILIEARQTFASGQERVRNHLPAEKMHPGESYLAAAQRCLAEELGVNEEESEILPDSYRERVKEQLSASYPGLTTRYHLHRLEARVPSLPGSAFSTAEKARGPGDPVNLHHWEWQPVRRPE